MIDTVGGAALTPAFAWLRRDGVLASAVAEPDRTAARRGQVRAEFVLVAVTAARLSRLAQLIDAGKLRAYVGGTLKPCSEARLAHRLKDGAPRPGKTVLVP